MKNWSFFIAFFFGLCHVVSCEYADQQKAEENTANLGPRYDSLNWFEQYEFGAFPSGDFRRKKDICAKLFRDAWVANKVSAGMLIAQHGKIIYENYIGMADVKKGIKMSKETPIHIASTSKVMTSLAILKLIESGRMNLEDTVGKILVGFPYTGVTIKDLLNHRSGLPNYLYFTSDPKLWEDQNKPLTNEDVLDIMIEHSPPRASAPGTHFSYNNTNYVILALIIERVTGMKYPDAMDYMVFKPIGMKNTYVMRFPQDTVTCSKSYYHNGKPWGFVFLDGTYGDKNIYSTPRDMFRLDVAMYSDKFLSPELKEEAVKGYSYESKGVKNYGLGIRMMEFDDGGKFLYHNGWWHGNNSVYVRDYAHEAVIIAFGNKYTRSVYAPFSLVTMFGRYQLPVDSTLIQAQDSIRLIQKMQDSIDKATKKSEKNIIIIPVSDTVLPSSHTRPPQKDTPFRYAEPKIENIER